MPQTTPKPATLVHLAKFFGAKKAELAKLSTDDKTELKALLGSEIASGAIKL